MPDCVRGYVSSRSCLGERIPQHVQNIVIRDFCQRNNLHYLLSAVEYRMPGSFLVLNRLLTELDHLSGIVFYSLFDLPASIESRHEIYQTVLSKKCALYFAVENTFLKSPLDQERLEDLFLVQQQLMIMQEVL